MDILSQQDLSTELLAELILKYAKDNSKASPLVNSFLAPMNLSCSVMNYASLVEWLSSNLKETNRLVMKRLFESMDFNFRNSQGRTTRYYVKHTRERTIITMFGEVTYKRTEYIDRQTGEPFVYVDREIGLFSRQRYDSTVSARAYELYSNQNSMIKVGEILGNEIQGFSLNNRQRYTISRQQIFNMINRFTKVITQCARVKETPKTLYISADEKYISLQQVRNLWYQSEIKKGRDRKEVLEELKTKHFDEMIKLAVVFTGREELLNKNGEPLKRRRFKLTGKWIMAFPDKSGKFWENAHDTLNELFDLDQVEHIYILGDGASWISNGKYELETGTTECDFALDRYHLKQAIHRMTKDKAQREKLYDYAIHGMKNSFKDLIKSLISESPDREESIKERSDYILKNMKGATIMEEQVKFGCAMEQAIQHVLASVFTSVPKAYATSHLHTYVNARINQQNGFDMQKLFLSAIDQSKAYGTDVDLSEKVDLTYFDKQVKDDAYHVNFNHFDSFTSF